MYSAEIVEILKTKILVRTSLKEGPNFKAELEAVLTSAQNWLVHIADKRKELKELQPGGGEGQNMDRKYFTKLMTAVSRHMKFHINPNEITTAQFASYVRDMRETYEAISKQNKNAA